MKRLLIIAAMAATLLSCSKDNESMPNGNESGFSVIARISNDDKKSLDDELSCAPQTRLTPDDQTLDKWTFGWEDGDKLYQPDDRLGCYSLTIEDSASDTPTFTGSNLKEDGSYYLFTIYDSFTVAEDASKLTEQDGTLSAIPMVSTEKVDFTTTSTASEVQMKHLGAFVKLNINLDATLGDYALTNISVSGLCSEIGYFKLSSFNPMSSGEFDLDSAISALQLRKSDIVVTPNRGDEFTATNGSYIIPIAIYPTVVERGDSILVIFAFEYSGKVVRVVQTMSPEDFDMTEFNFKRATVNNLRFNLSSDDILELEGSGQSSDPYKISTAADLNILATAINYQFDGYDTAYYELTNDIDLRGSADNKFDPIGDAFKQFKGVFDGGGHTISGLYIDCEDRDQGLFGQISKATIKNLGVNGSVKSSERIIGGIVGLSYNSTIINCFSDVEMTSIIPISTNIGSYVAGIAGSFCGSSAINCYNLGTIQGECRLIGGISGNVSEYLKRKSIIWSCYNAGKIINNNTNSEYDNFSDTGSIVGRFRDSGIYDCYFLDTSYQCAYGSGSYDYDSADAVSKNDATMKTIGFVDELNAAAKAYNAANPDGERACKWKISSTGGYPELDFGTVAE